MQLETIGCSQTPQMDRNMVDDAGCIAEVDIDVPKRDVSARRHSHRRFSMGFWCAGRQQINTASCLPLPPAGR
jgi:hypothetical protein